jgi:hypothetical protein
MKNTQQGNKRRKKKEGLKSKQKTTLENIKHTMVSLKEKKTRNLGPNPITNSTKQVVHKEGRKF